MLGWHMACRFMILGVIKHRRERSKFPRDSYLAMNFKGGGTSRRLWGGKNLKGELSKERGKFDGE
jgi:hypothetical protein